MNGGRLTVVSVDGVPVSAVPVNGPGVNDVLVIVGAGEWVHG